jgi:hypothetical protein
MTTVVSSVASTVSDLRHVAAVVGLLQLAVHDPVEGVRHVVGGERLPVVEGDALTDLVGPGQTVVGLLPGLGQSWLRREVLRGVAGEGVVHQRPRLVGRRGDALERVEVVDVLQHPHAEHQVVVRSGARWCAGRAHQAGHHDQGASSGHGSSVPPMNAGEPTTPPTARRAPTVRSLHGVDRVDDYAWLRDTSSPEVLAHLAAERAWYDAASSHSRSLVETLATEMSSRVPPADRSVSWGRLRFSYYTFTAAGREYPQLMRVRHHSDGVHATESVARTEEADENLRLRSCSTRRSTPAARGTSTSVCSR